ncbi:MAG: lytic murein transglycosylase B [Gammaproteobacteria bacterium]
MRTFIAAMASRHDFAAAELERLFNQIEPRQQVIDAITRPAEGKPWHRYRPIFLTERRIQEGVAFRRSHAATLERAQAVYGVPAEVITAILGVETFYGRHRGRYKVLESLATLAFDYPQRGKFFRSELEQFLLLTREEGLDPLSALGSYAGAMGQPQFIASSFRRYAVDFNNDGQRDIWDETADAIGSVANYLGQHGWQRGAAIATRAVVTGNDYRRGVRTKARKPTTSAALLQEHGVRPVAPLAAERKATLLALEGATGPEYWLTLDNFYVITRYNHSPLYAMAVYQLSREIARHSTAELAAHGR